MKDDDGGNPQLWQYREPGGRRRDMCWTTRRLLKMSLRVDGHAQFAPWSEVFRSGKTSVDESPSIPVPSREHVPGLRMRQRWPSAVGNGQVVDDTAARSAANDRGAGSGERAGLAAVFSEHGILCA